MDFDSLEQLYNEQLDDDLIIESNQNSLEEGIRPDGQLMDDYAERTIEIKRRDGGFISQSRRIALKDTGSWYDDMFIVKKKNTSFIDNKDLAMTDKLVTDFGDPILDIPEDEKEHIIEEAKPRFYEQINNKLNA